MEHHFWHERWQRDEIGFHRSEIHWALKAHWDAIADGSKADVLVPLCGKSLDMRWLRQRGHRVIGNELSGKAVSEFYSEWGREPLRTAQGRLNHWQADNIEIYEGDFFAYEPAVPFDLFYDRAALVALPQNTRQGYLHHLADCLSGQGRGLLITLEYSQNQMDGPPFSVTFEELKACQRLAFSLLERRDVLDEHPGFAARGLDHLHEAVYRVAPGQPDQRRQAYNM